MLIKSTRRIPFLSLRCSEYAGGAASTAKDKASKAEFRAKVNLLRQSVMVGGLRPHEFSMSVRLLSRTDRPSGIGSPRQPLISHRGRLNRALHGPGISSRR